MCVMMKSTCEKLKSVQSGKISIVKVLHFCFTFVLSMVKKIKLKELENWFGCQFYNTTTTTTNHFIFPDLRVKTINY